jgi:7,8-dihydroneopterin aldolase/epimerase/oxygenase
MNSRPVIKVDDIRCYAYHGCMEEEARIGGEFMVHVELEADIIPACLNDRLEDTIDYVEVYNIVKPKMQIRSRLIENVAWRILKALEERFRIAENIQVTVVKFNPPVNGDTGATSVKISTKDLTGTR